MALADPVEIRAPAAADARSFLAAVARSRRLHGRWVSAPRTPSEFVEAKGYTLGNVTAGGG